MHILKKDKTITETDPNWQWLWKLKLPTPITHFLWLLKLDRIVHNQMCVRRGITLNPFYKSCGMIESANHIFRACHRTGNVTCGKQLWESRTMIQVIPISLYGLMLTYVVRIRSLI